MKEWYKYKQIKRRASAFVEQTRTLLDEKDIDLYWETNVEKPIWEAYFRVICKEERKNDRRRTKRKTKNASIS